ncbi:hypothetical protein CAJAP_04286 [Camponotus japonicus]
MIKHIKNL